MFVTTGTRSQRGQPPPTTGAVYALMSERPVCPNLHMVAGTAGDDQAAQTYSAAKVPALNSPPRRM